MVKNDYFSKTWKGHKTMRKIIAVVFVCLLVVAMCVSVNSATQNSVAAKPSEGETNMIKLYPFRDKYKKWGYMNEKGGGDY